MSDKITKLCDVRQDNKTVWCHKQCDVTKDSKTIECHTE
jgi:hypothetical protein